MREYSTCGSVQRARSVRVPTAIPNFHQFPRYTTRKGDLIARYKWHLAVDFHCRMKMSRAISG